MNRRKFLYLFGTSAIPMGGCGGSSPSPHSESDPMRIEDIYRVTTKNKLLSNATIDAFTKTLKVPLPVGYRDYLTILGDGELCDLLRVRTPEKIEMRWAKDKRIRDSLAEAIRQGWLKSSQLTPDDMKEAVTFATSAEGDDFICCPRFGGDLFELPRHGDTIALMKDGICDAIASSVERMKHDFAFFEASDSLRRRGFEMRPTLGGAGFTDEVKRRWGKDGFRQSRQGPGETHPNLFVRPIQSRMVLYLERDGRNPPRRPHDAFPVVMSYDPENETEVTAFVDAVSRPGGESWVK